MNIIDFIPTGKENAVSKQFLCERTYTRDERMIRDAIKVLVREGTPILSSSGHKGYWVSDDIEEIGEFIRENKHRANEILRNIAKLEKLYYEMKNIKVTPVRQHFRRLDSGDIQGQIEMEVN